MRRWVIFVIVLLLLIWLITGGLVIRDYWTYGGGEQVNTGIGQPFAVWVDTQPQDSWIPPFIVYSKDTLPYSIKLTVVDNENISKKLTIASMRISFDSGEEASIILPQDNWSRDFEDYVYYNSTSEGVVRKQALRLQHTFAGVINRPENIRLKIQAEYELKNGRLIPASINKYYKVRKHRYLQTGWERISGI